MKLKRVLAEYLYLKEHSYLEFENLDSNQRDEYSRRAAKLIIPLIGSYLSEKQWLGKVVRGNIKSFLDAHQNLQKDCVGSLSKRIVGGIRGTIKSELAHD